ncbi:MAG: prepilin-type N-terminal cleavage/methylation domain-containing protein, partial [Candidatus Binatia bacterium]
MNNRRAFTLIEVIVILAVLSILVGIAVPAALRIFEVTAEEATRDEMGNIKRAILGDARKLQSFFRSDFGYLGDIGCLPDDLRRILFNPPPTPPVIPALPTWTFDTTQQTGAGWKGPYITGATIGQEVEEFTRDQWGNDYTYTVTGGPCPPTPMTATLTSGGADLTSAADDITLTIEANETTATVRGSVKDTAGVGLAAVTVEFYSAANNGNLTTTAATTDINGNYTFVLAPFGQRAVRASPTLALVPGSVAVTGGADNNVDFQLINFSTSS